MKVENLDRLKKKIAALPKAAFDEMHKALDKSADEMVDAAKRFAPVKSGALKASIGYTFGDYKPDNANVRGMRSGAGLHDLAVTIHAGNKRAWYAALVEFGTRAHIIKASEGKSLYIDGKAVGDSVSHPGGDASPYFFPAYRLTKKRAKSRMTRAIKTALKKVVAK